MVSCQSVLAHFNVSLVLHVTLLASAIHYDPPILFHIATSSQRQPTKVPRQKSCWTFLLTKQAKSVFSPPKLDIWVRLFDTWKHSNLNPSQQTCSHMTQGRVPSFCLLALRIPVRPSHYLTSLGVW